MERTKVNLLGIELDNPVIPASGTFGYGREFAELYDINILGTFSFKGTTLHPRLGNPLPRIAEAPAGMLNAVGLQNPGVDRVISEELPNLATIFHKPVMANVSGFSVDEQTVFRLKGLYCIEGHTAEVPVDTVRSEIIAEFIQHLLQHSHVFTTHPELQNTPEASGLWRGRRDRARLRSDRKFPSRPAITRNV